MARASVLTVAIMFLAGVTLPPANAAQVVGQVELVRTDRAFDLAWDGTALWSLDWLEPVVRRDPRDGQPITSYRYWPSALMRYGIDWDGTALWCASGDGRASLYRVDPNTGAIERSIRLGAHPGSPELTALACRDSSIWTVFSDVAGSYVGSVNPRSGAVGNLAFYRGLTFHGLTWADTLLLASSARTHMIYVLSASGGVLDVFPAPVQRGDNGPYGLAWDGHFLWVNCTPHLYRVDLAAQPTERLITVSRQEGPQRSDLDCALDLDVDSSSVWCANYPERRLYRMDKGAPRLSFEYLSPPFPPAGVARVGAHLWIGSQGFTSGTLVEMSLAGHEERRIPFDQGVPTGIDTDGSSIWVVGTHLGVGPDEIVRIGTFAGNVLSSIEAPSTGTIGITWDGRSLWSADWLTDKLSRLDASGRVEAEYELPVGRVGGVEYDSTEDKFWLVTTSENHLYRVGLPTGPGVLDWRAASTPDAVVLAWRQAAEPPIMSTVVERADAAGGGFAEFGTVTGAMDTMVFSDRSVQRGRIYYYRLRLSTAAGEKTVGPLCVPYYFEYPRLTTPITISDLVCEPVASGVRVYWSMAPDEFEVIEAGIEGAVSPDGPYRMLRERLPPRSRMDVMLDSAVIENAMWYRVTLALAGGSVYYSNAVTPGPAQNSQSPAQSVTIDAIRDCGAGCLDIYYSVPQSRVAERIDVHDARGRTVRTLAPQNDTGGQHRVRWELEGGAGRLARGMYIIRVSSPEGTAARKIFLSGR